MADSDRVAGGHAADLRALLAALRLLEDAHAPEQLAPALANATDALLHADAILVWLRDDDGALLQAAPGHPAMPRLELDAERLQALANGGVLTEALAAPTLPGALCVPFARPAGALLGVLELQDSRIDAFDAHTAQLAQALATHAAAVLQLARHEAAIRHARHLHAEAETARGIQRSTLPTEMPPIPGYDLHGHFQPATYAGGDLFDAVLVERGLFLLLGDATGHGLGPALSATQMQGMLRVAFRLGADLEQAFRHVNNQLAEDLPDDRFVTALAGFLDPRAHALHYYCAGQPFLHFHAAEARCEWVEPNTFPVGVLHHDAAIAGSTLAIAPGDVLALVSDGLYEQPDAAGAEFGQDRVAELLRQGHALPMAALCERMLAALRDFSAGTAQVDDITILLVRRLP